MKKYGKGGKDLQTFTLHFEHYQNLWAYSILVSDALNTLILTVLYWWPNNLLSSIDTCQYLCLLPLVQSAMYGCDIGNVLYNNTILKFEPWIISQLVYGKPAVAQQ